MIRHKVVRIVDRGIKGFVRTSCYAQGKFCKEYKKGTVITAVEDTDGVYVFDNEKNANEFIRKHSRRFIKIKVRTIGKSKKAKYVCGNQNERDLVLFWHTVHFFPYFLQDEILFPPQGTLVYKAVEILE